MLDLELGAGIVEGVRPEELAGRHGAFDLVDSDDRVRCGMVACRA